MDELVAGVLARGPVAGALTSAAWLQAMVDAEVALAHARDPASAAAVADAARGLDVAALGAAATEAGNPVVPLVRALRASAPHAHAGATSQDIVDTALMLLVREALGLVGADLRGAADAAARLAREHRDTVMAGRTLLQQAVPTTFGLKAAGWMTALDRARGPLAAYAPLAQLGGAAGTVADAELVSAFAARLGLAAPVLPWHTDRTPIGALAGALGVACGAVGKAALDVVLLAQNEVAEVSEAVGGSSSAMPHKQNPIAAISARACAKRAPGLVATLLATMEHEHERAAGAWHAEWLTLRDLLVTTGSAAAWLRTSLEGLRVDPERMRANLIIDDRDPGAAGVLVDRALEARA